MNITNLPPDAFELPSEESDETKEKLDSASTVKKPEKRDTEVVPQNFVPWDVDHYTGNQKGFPKPLLIKKKKLELLRFYFRDTVFGVVAQSIQMALAVAWCALFLFEIYTTSTTDKADRLPYIIVDTVFACIFLLFAAIRYILAEHIYTYVTAVDLLAIIPSFVRWATFAPAEFALLFFRFLYLLKIVRLLDPLRRYPIMGFIVPIFKVVLGLIVALLTVAALVLFIEPQTFPDLQTSFYFSVATFATIGYGDITPKTVWGRVLLTIIILLIFVAVPFVTVQLSKAVAEFPRPIDATYKRKHNESHIVVCGVITVEILDGFLSSLLHKSREQFIPSKVIILVPDEPNDEMKHLIIRYYGPKVKYLKGSPLNIDDIKRTRIHEATGVFLFSHSYTTAPWDEDCETRFRVLSIRSVTKTVPIYVQLLRPENVRAVLEMGPNIIPVSVTGLKLKLLARATTIPGIPALIGNLLRHTTYAAAAQELDLHEGEDLELYCRGQNFELYVGTFPPSFNGLTFETVVLACYEQRGILLVAIQTDHDMKVAKMEHVIVEGDTGHFLAPSLECVQNLDSVKIQNIIICRRRDAQVTRYPSEIAETVSKERKQGRRVEVDLQSLKDHIIVACDGRENADIIWSLRAADQKKPIVILSLVKSSLGLTKGMMSHLNVYHVKGSSLEKKDWDRAGAKRAAFIMLMTGEKSYFQNKIDRLPNLMDRDTILAYKLVSRHYHNATPLVEIRREENYRYLTGPYDTPAADEESRPKDPMELRFFERKSELTKKKELAPAFAAGLTYSPSILSSLLAQIYYNPASLNVVDEFLVACGNPKSRNLWLIKCPDECLEKPFIEVMKFLLPREILPIGIYRPSSMALELAKHIEEERVMDIEALSGEPLAPYSRLKNECIVITCPPKDTVIGVNVKQQSFRRNGDAMIDRIYVLASKEDVTPYLEGE